MQLSTGKYGKIGLEYCGLLIRMRYGRCLYHSGNDPNKINRWLTFNLSFQSFCSVPSHFCHVPEAVNLSYRRSWSYRAQHGSTAKHTAAHRVDAEESGVCNMVTHIIQSKQMSWHSVITNKIVQYDYRTKNMFTTDIFRSRREHE